MKQVWQSIGIFAAGAALTAIVFLLVTHEDTPDVPEAKNYREMLTKKDAPDVTPESPTSVKVDNGGKLELGELPVPNEADTEPEPKPDPANMSEEEDISYLYDKVMSGNTTMDEQLECWEKLPQSEQFDECMRKIEQHLESDNENVDMRYKLAMLYDSKISACRTARRGDYQWPRLKTNGAKS